jgi:hypothetical protein
MPSVHSASGVTLKVWNADPAIVATFASNLFTPSSGIEYFTAISVPYTMTVNNIWIWQTTGAIAGTSGAFYGHGIYDTSGNLLASTSNQVSSGSIGLTGALSWALSSSYSLSAGNYMIGFLWYQGTGGTPTTPVFGKPSGATTTQINLNVPTPSSGKLDQRACTAGSGRTSLYNPMNTTPTASASNFWVALS